MAQRNAFLDKLDDVADQVRIWVYLDTLVWAGDAWEYCASVKSMNSLGGNLPQSADHNSC